MPITVGKLKEKGQSLSPEDTKYFSQSVQMMLKNLLVNSVKIDYPKPGEYRDLYEAMPYVSSISLTNPNISEEKSAIAILQQTDPTNFQHIAASQLDLSNSYYTSVRNQSEQSFLWSRITSGIGLAFFHIAVVFFIIRLENISYINAVGGALVEVYAGLIQWQGKLTADQAKEYHVHLDRVQRFVIANSACKGLNDAEKQQKRSEIISKLVE
jgi:hypothetical protein